MKLAKLSLLAIFFEGATVLSLEIAVTKIMAPYFGESLALWTIILGTSFSALAIGYWLGDKIILTKNHKQYFWDIFLFGSLITSTIPLFGNYAIHALGRLPYTAHILTLSVFLISIPLVLFGTLPPLASRLVNPQSSGKSTGKVYGISTLGGIIGAIAFVLFALPQFGIKTSILFIGFLNTFIACALYYIPSKKWSYTIFVPCLAWLTFAPNNTLTNKNILLFEEGLQGQLAIADIPLKNDTQRFLLLNRLPESSLSLKTNKPSLMEYIPLVQNIYNQAANAQNVLILGMGGGNLVNALKTQHNFIDAVEFDNRIAQAGIDYFNLTPDFNLIIDDARHYLNTCSKQYDFIVLDLFKGENPPEHLLTKEVFEKLQAILNLEGVIVVNFNGFLTGKLGYGGRSVIKTCIASGLKTQVIAANKNEEQRNTLFILTKKDFNLHKSETYISLHNIDTANAIVLTDNYPKLDIINRNAAIQWREAYRGYFSGVFEKSDLPLYQ